MGRFQNMLNTVKSGLTSKFSGIGDKILYNAGATVAAAAAATVQNATASLMSEEANQKHKENSEGTNAINVSPDINTMCDINVDHPDSYTLIIGNGGGKGESYWTLPLPMQLNYNSEYQWKDEDIGVTAGLAGAGWDTLYQSDELLKLINGGLFSGKSDTKFSSGLKSLLKKNGDKSIDATKKEFMRFLGEAKNPNKHLYFTGLDLRKFTLSFSLAPTSEKEAENIKKGFQKLAFIAAPSFTRDTAFFTYPEMVGVEVKLNKHTVLKRGALVITAINLDFTSDGPLTYHDDGMPTAMQLNIEFQETIIPTRENLQNVIVMDTILGSGS